MSKLIRLYPRHPQLGYVLRSYTVQDPPLRFMQERGWYEVDDEVADMLKDVLQQERYPNGPKAFLIAADTAEAKKLDAKVETAIQKAAKTQAVGTVEKPVPATSKRPGAKKRATVAVSDKEEAAEPKPRTRKRKAPAA